MSHHNPIIDSGIVEAPPADDPRRRGSYPAPSQASDNGSSGYGRQMKNSEYEGQNSISAHSGSEAPPSLPPREHNLDLDSQHPAPSQDRSTGTPSEPSNTGIGSGITDSASPKSLTAQPSSNTSTNLPHLRRGDYAAGGTHVSVLHPAPAPVHNSRAEMQAGATGQVGGGVRGGYEERRAYNDFQAGM